MPDRETITVAGGPDAGTGSVPTTEGGPGAPRAIRGRGTIVVLGAVVVVLAAIVVYLAAGTGSGDTGGVPASFQGDPTTALNTARADRRPAYVLAHSAT